MGGQPTGKFACRVFGEVIYHIHMQRERNTWGEKKRINIPQCLRCIRKEDVDKVEGTETAKNEDN